MNNVFQKPCNVVSCMNIEYLVIKYLYILKNMF